MKLVHFGELTRKSMKVVAAAVLAIMVSTSPMVFDLLTDSDTVQVAMAGRPQTGPGEW